MNESKIFILKKGEEIILFFVNHIMAVHTYALMKNITPLLEKGKINKVWIDFNKCRYIDSTTIGTLIIIKKKLNKNYGKLILCNLNNEIKNIFIKMGLENFFTIITNKKFKKIENEFIEEIEANKTEKIKAEFILDAHNKIIEISPHLKDTFKNVFEVLEQEVE